MSGVWYFFLLGIFFSLGFTKGETSREKEAEKKSGRVLQGGVDWIGRRWAGLFFHYFIPPGMLAYGTD
jgi:hypothetical protein